MMRDKAIISTSSLDHEIGAGVLGEQSSIKSNMARVWNEIDRLQAAIDQLTKKLEDVVSNKDAPVKDDFENAKPSLGDSLIGGRLGEQYVSLSDKIDRLNRLVDSIDL